MPQSQAGELAYQACLKHKDMPTRSLAVMLYEKFDDIYTSVEHARKCVRRYRGQTGAKDKASVKHREAYSKAGDDRRSTSNVAVIPSARILLFDIETAPHLAYVWRCFKENISPAQMVKHTTVLCWAAKWLDEKTIMYDSVPYDDYENDRAVCMSLWKLIDKADIVVAHNGRAFDHPLMRTRWLQHGIPPPSPYQMVDTCKLAQQHFSFPRSKLESIAQYIGVGTKTPHDGFKLWTDCMAGDNAAWKRMREYNMNDVALLEEVYLRLRCWDNRHPNVSLDYDDTRRCIVCGSTAIKSLPKMTRTGASVFDSFRCESCGKVMRNRSRVKPCVAADERMAHSL